MFVPVKSKDCDYRNVCCKSLSMSCHLSVFRYCRTSSALFVVVLDCAGSARLPSSNIYRRVRVDLRDDEQRSYQGCFGECYASELHISERDDIAHHLVMLGSPKRCAAVQEPLNKNLMKVNINFWRHNVREGLSGRTHGEHDTRTSHMFGGNRSMRTCLRSTDRTSCTYQRFSSTNIAFAQISLKYTSAPRSLRRVRLITHQYLHSHAARTEQSEGHMRPFAND